MCSVFEDKFVDTHAVPNARENLIAFGIMKDLIELVDGNFQLPLLHSKQLSNYEEGIKQ